jgi:hypothetical protein
VKLYGVWFPFERGRWLSDVAGFDLVTSDQTQARGYAAEHYLAHAVEYTRGHYFHVMFGACNICKATPEQARGRWCPHSNPPPELEARDLARRLWDTDDRVAALTVEAAEGNEPSMELLQRLYDRDVRGLRGEAEARAKTILGR